VAGFTLGFFLGTRGVRRELPRPGADKSGALTFFSLAWSTFVFIRRVQGAGDATADKRHTSATHPVTDPVPKRNATVSDARRRFGVKAIYGLMKTSVSQWIEDFAPSMGAALSYYTVFSIAPLLVIAIAVAALVFGQSAAQQEILAQIRDLLGPEGANAIESMLVSAQKPKEGAIAGALSILTLVIGATTVFNELESDLNRIWRVPASKQSGIWNFLRTRLLSLGLVVSIGFLLLVSLIANAALAAWGRYWSGWFFGVEVALQAANILLSLAVFTLLFALMYKVLPRVHIAWRDVWVGAAVTSILFAVGKFLIGLYIGRTSVASSYGAAGALAVLLLWVYYSSQVFLFGAEFTRAYAESHGSRKPEGARPATGSSKDDSLQATSFARSKAECDSGSLRLASKRGTQQHA
jgi:YihY family inner membrane protein